MTVKPDLTGTRQWGNDRMRVPVSRRSLMLMAVMLLAAVMVSAQDARAPVGIVGNPCPPPVVMPDSIRVLLTELFMVPRTLRPEDLVSLPGNAEFANYLAALNDQSIQDWPRLCRFRAANDDLLARDVQPGLVFMGDSITENWLLGDPALFGDAHVNRGIGGQTTPQMLLRFRSDVVELQPQAVHILAGTNDVAGNTGPLRAQDFRNNIMAMVAQAQASGIAVILGSIPPAASFDWQPAVDPLPRIRELNAWLQAFAAEHGLGYIDYYSALAGPNGELRAELGNDGVHPNRDGYAIMRKLLEEQLTNLNH